MLKEIKNILFKDLESFNIPEDLLYNISKKIVIETLPEDFKQLLTILPDRTEKPVSTEELAAVLDKPVHNVYYMLSNINKRENLVHYTTGKRDTRKRFYYKLID